MAASIVIIAVTLAVIGVLLHLEYRYDWK